MHAKKIGVGLLLIITMIVSACGGASVPAATTQPETPVETAVAEKSTPAGEVMETKATEEVMTTEKASTEEAMVAKESTDEAVMEAEATEEVIPEKAPTDEAMATPAWFNVELIDANTGETFKIADFKGKVVLVETMAVWCPLCTQQQGQIRALHDLLGKQEDLVSLSLDIDPNEDVEFLQAHVNQNGFDWRYAVAPAEVSREIGQLYGAQFLNPPATPMLIIDRQGEVHLLPFGQKDAPTLQEALTPLLNEG